MGRDALIGNIVWDETHAFRLGSDAIFDQYRALAQQPGKVARKDGDPDSALAAAERVIEAEYRFPYLAHAAMEPLNCVIAPDAEGDGGGVRVYNGEQFQTADQAAVAEVLGLAPEQVKIDMLYAGGSFGRRANPSSDFVVEAARIFKAAGGKLPVKLQWLREDDMRAGWYRPLYLHRLRAGLDAEGRPVAWEHRIVGQSIATGTGFEQMLVVDEVDQTSVEGAKNLPYAIPNLLNDLHSPTLAVPVQWWRSVGSTHTAYATECMIDALAEAAGADPVDYRMRLLADHPRHQGVHDGVGRAELALGDAAVTKVFGPAWHLLLIGDGQLARTLARMARMLDYRVTICDPREAFADPDPLPDVRYTRQMPDDAVRSLADDPRSAVVTLAHDPRQDDLGLIEALPSRAFYVGALGSRRSAASRAERLAAMGLSPMQIDRLDAPAGIDIGSKRPAEIALSILAGLTAVRNGLAGSEDRCG